RKDVNLFRAVGDSDIERQSSLKTALSSDELEKLKAVETAVKEARVPDAQTIHAYNEIVIKKLLPLEYITHNAVILFVLEMFDRFPEVKRFYQSYYPLIVV
ncbi:MAG TPA: hypothetical protein DHW79_10225, partial [Candidatus Cloacimonas sp.]|nr:hypothetical protein [Candidatus Cloacimonas sp.]